MTESFRIRPARTSDVPAVKKLVAPLAEQRILMAKETVAYYESLQEFRIAAQHPGQHAHDPWIHRKSDSSRPAEAEYFSCRTSNRG